MVQVLTVWVLMGLGIEIGLGFGLGLGSGLGLKFGLGYVLTVRVLTARVFTSNPVRAGLT